VTPVETVVCFKWARPGYRSTFGPETVNTLRRMVARHYPHPHRFLCVTDDPAGLDPAVTVLPDFKDFVDVQSPYGGKNPSCYRRLRLYHPEAERWFGARFVAIDLDTVITSDLRPLWDRSEDYVVWGDTNRTTHYNGSMVLMTAGARSKVWTQFNPKVSPWQAKQARQFGSDQGWISYCLGPGEATWSKADGVYSFRNHLSSNGRTLPDDARIVFFHGQYDPWSPYVTAHYPWVREHYQ
jgi:hypothetical protein